MKYTEGYHYQLSEDEVFSDTGIEPVKQIKSKFITLTPEGKLTVKAGYAWDGPSGPTLDTPSSMRGSCGHDALYQLMREGRLQQKWRGVADEAFGRWLKQDGMWGWRRWFWVREVKKFAGSAADPKNKKEILTAP